MSGGGAVYGFWAAGMPEEAAGRAVAGVARVAGEVPVGGSVVGEATRDVAVAVTTATVGVAATRWSRPRVRRWRSRSHLRWPA